MEDKRKAPEGMTGANHIMAINRPAEGLTVSKINNKNNTDISTEFKKLLLWYGLEWADFRHFGCGQVKHFFDKERPAISYPLLTADGSGKHFKFKSLERFKDGRRDSRNTPGARAGFFPGETVPAGDTTQRLVIVGGEEKALAAIKAGFRATSCGGECLSEEAARLLIQYGNRSFIIAFDADNAGRNGTEKSIEALRKVDPTVEIRFLEWPAGSPKGYDLNDVLVTNGAEEIRKLLYWDDLSEPTDKKQKSRSIQEFVWPELKALEKEEDLPEPPLELLDHCGDWQRKFVESLAESRQVPAEAVLIAFFTAVSAAAMRIAEVPYQRYEQYDSKAYHPLGLYSIVVAPTGGGKSPVVNAVETPIKTWFSKFKEDNRGRLQDNRDQLTAIEAANRRILKRIEKAVEDDNQEDVKQLREARQKLRDQLQEIGDTDAPNWMVNDATPAGMFRTLSAKANREQLFISSCEYKALQILLGAKFEADSDADLDAILKAWDGSGLSQSRGDSEKNFHIENPRIAILLAGQDSVLNLLRRNNCEALERGFLGRIIPVVMRDIVGFRNVKAKALPESLANRYECWIHDMLDLGYKLGKDNPIYLEIGPTAHELYTEYREDLEIRRRPGGDLRRFPALLAWTAKLHDHARRIAAVLHVLKHGRDITNRYTEISADTMIAGIRFARFFEKHAVRLLEKVAEIEPSVDDAISLFEIIRKLEAENNEPVKRTSLWESKAVLKLFGRNRETLDSLIRKLENAGWIRCIETAAAGGRIGRPQRSYQTNPEWNSWEKSITESEVPGGAL